MHNVRIIKVVTTYYLNRVSHVYCLIDMEKWLNTKTKLAKLNSGPELSPTVMVGEATTTSR